MEIELGANFYSPRWGHDDRYKFRFSENSLEISHGARKSKAEWQENIDPNWVGESIIDIMRNDSIYAPFNLQDLIEHLWLSWRNAELNDPSLQDELDALARYVNACTAAKPKTDFWEKYF